MLNWISKLFGSKKQPKTKVSSAVETLISKKKKLIKDNGCAWELKRDGITLDFYANINKVAKAHFDLSRNKLYYQVNKNGTYKDEKYELICQKY